jgi:hypothetical protein
MRTTDIYVQKTLQFSKKYEDNPNRRKSIFLYLFAPTDLIKAGGVSHRRWQILVHPIRGCDAQSS